MDVLITGGTGFIGSRLALACLKKGDQVRVLGQNNNLAETENKAVLEKRGAEVIIASVTDNNGVNRSVEGIEVVFHLAAAQHEANVPDQHFWDVNVAGTKNVLDASIAAGVKRFVHGSTIGVYDPLLEGNIDEKSSLNPDNIYGVTKLEGEKLINSYQGKLPALTIRISETYGPGDRRLLKLFKTIKKKQFFVIGDGNNLHHLIFIDDLIDGMQLAANVDEAIGNTFVLAGKEPLTTNEMVETIATELHAEINHFHAPLSFFSGAAIIMETMLKPLGITPPLHRRRMDFFKKSFVFSQDLARNILGFVPKTDFREGVAKTAEWYSEQGLL